MSTYNNIVDDDVHLLIAESVLKNEKLRIELLMIFETEFVKS